MRARHVDFVNCQNASNNCSITLFDIDVNIYLSFFFDTSIQTTIKSIKCHLLIEIVYKVFQMMTKYLDLHIMRIYRFWLYQEVIQSHGLVERFMERYLSLSFESISHSTDSTFDPKYKKACCDRLYEQPSRCLLNKLCMKTLRNIKIDVACCGS